MDGKLFDILGSLNFEEYGGIAMTSSEWDGDDLTLRIQVHTGIKNEVQSWIVKAINVRSERLIREGYDNFEIYDDHPLLWEYSQPRSALYIKDKPKQPLSLLGALYITHKETTKNSIEFSRYLNHNLDLEKLFRTGHGLIAEGPVNLLEKYSTCLNRYEIKTSMVTQNSDVIRERAGENSKLKVFIMGSCYIIAESFSFSSSVE